MGATSFDTLGYFEKLKAAGVPDNQAKVLANALREIVEDKLATRRDLKDLETSLKRDMAEMKVDLIKWMFAMFLAFTTLIIGAFKLLS